MSLSVSVRFKLSCPHHLRYNPESSGEGGIRAGCEICAQLFAAWKESIDLANRLVSLGDKICAVRMGKKA